MFSLAALQLAIYLTCVAGQAVPYYDPRLTGGSLLTLQNEPLNVGVNDINSLNVAYNLPVQIIVSALSSPDALTLRGIVNYGNALG